MYENLENLAPERTSLLSSLEALSNAEIDTIKQIQPLLPDEYLQFLAERGVGALCDKGEHFVFEKRLLSAERDYFRDQQIYDHGAVGDILIFGWESMGTAYGFDTGDDWKIVEVDEYRIVTELDLSFKYFVEGLLVCYPQIPMKYEAGIWEDGMKRKYT